MEKELLCAVTAAESWTVSYGEDICYDARKVDEVWYFRESANDFRPFPNQERVKPICTNPTRLRTSNGNPPGEPR